MYVLATMLLVFAGAVAFGTAPVLAFFLLYGNWPQWRPVLKEHQPLTAGLAALFAAGLATFGVLLSNANQRELSERQTVLHQSQIASAFLGEILIIADQLPSLRANWRQQVENLKRMTDEKVPLTDLEIPGADHTIVYRANSAEVGQFASPISVNLTALYGMYINVLNIATHLQTHPDLTRAQKITVLEGGVRMLDNSIALAPVVSKQLQEIRDTSTNELNRSEGIGSDAGGGTGSSVFVRVLAEVSRFPIPTIGAALSLLTLILVYYTQIARPRSRRRKLKRPCDAYFIVTSADRRRLGYVSQDEREHFLKELVVPAGEIVPIEILIEPRMNFRYAELIFGFEDMQNLTSKPVVESFYAPFIVRGARQKGSPENNYSHYVDHHGHYHIAENRDVSLKTYRSMGFSIRTREPGVYAATIAFTGDEVEGETNLKLRVEAKPETTMTCAWPTHDKCKLTPLPLQAV
jgi:hypothetical protein